MVLSFLGLDHPLLLVDGFEEQLPGPCGEELTGAAPWGCSAVLGSVLTPSPRIWPQPPAAPPPPPLLWSPHIFALLSDSPRLLGPVLIFTQGSLSLFMKFIQARSSLEVPSLDLLVIKQFLFPHLKLCYQLNGSPQYPIFVHFKAQNVWK